MSKKASKKKSARGPGRPPLPEGEKLSATIILKVLPADKKLFLKASGGGREKGGNMAGWMRDVCRRAAGRAGK